MDHDDDKIKAIATNYDGQVFRSRVEARWAVFFDMLKIKWFYEYEGFELPSGRYLPDFWLPHVNGGMWVEIKGDYPTTKEKQKAYDLHKMTGQMVLVQSGSLEPPKPNTRIVFAKDKTGPQYNYYWLSCHNCESIVFGPCKDDSGDYAKGWCSNPQCLGEQPKPHLRDRWPVVDAFEEAARYWFHSLDGFVTNWDVDRFVTTGSRAVKDIARAVPANDMAATSAALKQIINMLQEMSSHGVTTPAVRKRRRR